MCVCPSACRFVSFNVEVKGQGHNKFSILHCDTIFLKVFSMQSVAFILYKKVFLYQKKIPIDHKCLSVCDLFDVTHTASWTVFKRKLPATFGYLSSNYILIYTHIFCSYMVYLYTCICLCIYTHIHVYKKHGYD